MKATFVAKWALIASHAGASIGLWAGPDFESCQKRLIEVSRMSSVIHDRSNTIFGCQPIEKIANLTELAWL